MTQNIASEHYRTTLSGYVFATKACVDDRKKKLVKQQYLLHMFSQYGERHPTNGWDSFDNLEHPGIFQWVSRLCFVAAPTSLNVHQPNFARCLAVSWVLHYIYILGGSCLLMEFCQVHNSRCVQVLHYPILAALLHGTWAAGVS